MKVYVLEVGAYEQREVRGVFSSPEQAMEAYNPKRPRSYAKYSHHPLPSWEWKFYEQSGEWWFDGDDSSCASLEAYEIDGSSA